MARAPYGLREARQSRPHNIAGWAYDEQVRLLDKLLRSAVGTRRARDLAVGLMGRFGSLPGILRSDPRLLREMPGIGPATVRLLSTTLELAEKLAHERIDTRRPLLSSSSELTDYLFVTMAFLPVEQSRVLFLDKKNRLIADEVQQTGTIDHTPLYPRQVIKRALDLAASALILVHNHPSGDPAPSSADVTTTRNIALAGERLGITLHDHVVIGHSGHSSLRALKLL